jgi:hypothetical protein
LCWIGEIVLAIGRRIDLGAAGLFFLHSDEIATVAMVAELICRDYTAASIISRLFHDALWEETEVVSAAARRKSQTTIRSWLAFGARSDHIAGSPIVYWIGSRIADLESDTWTRVLSTTADCPSIGSDMLVGSPE